MMNDSGVKRREKADLRLDVIPARLGEANPEPRDSPMRNCASEVWSFWTVPE